MALFQTSVLTNYLKRQDNIAVAKAYKKFATYFKNAAIQQNIRESKEEQYQEGFLRELFVTVFGYTLNPHADYNLTTELKNEKGAKKADGAILKNGTALAVIELKGTKTKDLESVRQQAFDYKANQTGCVFVITSNFEKLRFYINNAVEYEEFDLFNLTEDQFALLYLCLEKDNLLNSVPLKIKEESLQEEEQITKRFYADYSLFKRELFRDLVKQNMKNEVFRAELNKEDTDRAAKNIKHTLFKKSQKLIDRFLFIFFAEDRDLLPPNSTLKILESWEQLKNMDAYAPLYDRFKIYFNYLDIGRQGTDKKAEIFAYNGGLFKPDSVLNSLIISDELLHRHTKTLSHYDFASQVDVNILGHIFENSLNEIESVNAEIEGVEFDKQKTKRKKDGVFYTPKYITKYIVENTVGKLCEEKKSELGIVEDDYLKNRKHRKKEKLKELQERLDAYRKWLLKLTICDPACGSGAFLNQALDFLIKEHQYLDELQTSLLGGGFTFPDIENTVLENNIFGVDLNEESVEIAKLSLWLRTAQPRRKLNDLSSNIKCGNSLIDDKAVAGDKAFNWYKEFPQVFGNEQDIEPLMGLAEPAETYSKKGFDIVIGNPPYVQHRKLFDLSRAFKANYKVYTGTSDLSVYFFEKALSLLKQNGYLGFINTNKFFNTEYGKPLRDLLSSYCIQEIVNFEQAAIFEGALVSSTIIIIEKAEPNDGVQYVEFVKENITPEKFENERKYRFRIVNNKYLKEKSWVFESPIIESLLEKIKSKGISFGEMDSIKINRGLTTGYDDAFIISEEKYFEFIKQNESSQNILKPLLKGKHINRYFIENSRLRIINSHNGLRGKFDRINLKEEFPLIYDHLVSINESSEGNVEKRSDKGEHWTNLRSCAFLEEFEKPKVVWGLISGNWSFAVDNDRNYLTSASYFLTSEKADPTVFAALMNSRLFKFYFENVGEMTAGGAYVLKKTSIEKFIYPINIEKKDAELITEKVLSMQILIKQINTYITSFNNLVQSKYTIENLSTKLQKWNELEFKDFLKELKKAKIQLSLPEEAEWMQYFNSEKEKEQALKKQIKDTDEEIDNIVYKLYELTDDEIKIVEG